MKSRSVLVNAHHQNVASTSNLNDKSRVSSAREGVESPNMSPSHPPEPLMSTEEWRKKASGRRERRAMLLGHPVPRPINIACDSEEFVLLPLTNRTGRSGSDTDRSVSSR